jgi:hypothetical protein
MPLTSAFAGRQSPPPLHRESDDSLGLSPTTLPDAGHGVPNDRPAIAPRGKGAPFSRDQNAVGIATIWLVLYLLIAGGWWGVQLLSRASEVAALH